MSAATMRVFRARVSAVADVTPSFRRFTFTGDELSGFGDPGFDQRIKMVFPSDSASLDLMPTGDDWYTEWRQLPESTRPPFRTYTTRRVRRGVAEIDVDMVAHEVLGPASAWISRAQPGDEVLIVGPPAEYTGVSLGVDFVPPARTGRFLLAGDETAAPAIAVILEQLPAAARGSVVLELPDAADAAYLPRHPGFDYHVRGRADGERHAHLVPTVKEVSARLVPQREGAAVEVEEIDVDVDAKLLWEVPRTAKGGAALAAAPVYAWLAGEAGAIKALRRHLVTELGIDRRAVAFMGYWRAGHAEY